MTNKVVNIKNDAKVDVAMSLSKQKLMLNSILRLKLGTWHFQPGILSSLFTITLLSILVYLGTWQMDRAKEKKIFHQSLILRSQLPHASLFDYQDTPFHELKFKPFEITGRYLSNQSFLLDNQVVNKKAGTQVITPLEVPGLDRYVLIDRGWVPFSTPSRTLPTIVTPQEALTIRGIVHHLSTGILLKPDKTIANPTWPLIIQSLDYELIEKQLGHPIFNFVVQLPAHSQSSYQHRPIHFGLTHEKHLGYALQWFTMALLLVIYYFVTNVQQRIKDDGPSS